MFCLSSTTVVFSADQVVVGCWCRWWFPNSWFLHITSLYIHILHRFIHTYIQTQNSILLDTTNVPYKKWTNTALKTFFFILFLNIKHYWHLRHIFVLHSERVIIHLDWWINVCPLNWEWVGWQPWSSVYASQCLSRPTTVWTDERPAVTRMC